MNTPANLLLISTSTVYGTGYLDHAEEEIRSALGSVRRVIFIPYALADRKAYSEKAVTRFESMGVECNSIDEFENPAHALSEVPAIFVGGGNTFRLLKALQDLALVEVIRQRVQQGMIYMGASAGSNVACPTIRTTNDMPIVEPAGLNALNLFPWQINPHYVDTEAATKHMGETREERLLQYLEENPGPVIGLREGAMLRVCAGKVFLKGVRGAKIFRRGQVPENLLPPTEIAI